ncbi:MAG: PH domain-containing protein, partial [Planctomycetota bacterium]
EAAIGAIVPVIIGSLFAGPVAFLGFGIYVFAAAATNAIRYYTLRYRLVDDELVIHSGLLNRRERRIPFDRVQEVTLQQGILHRVCGFAKIEVSTAGSDTNEATLDALSRVSAERLRQVVAKKQSVKSHATKETSAGASTAVVAPDALSTSDQETPTDYAFDLDLRTLILGGITSRVVAFGGAIVGTIIYFQVFGAAGDKFLGFLPPRLRERFRFPGWEGVEAFEKMVPDSGVGGFIADIWFTDNIGKSLLVAVGGVLITVGAYVFRYFSFRLTRTGDALSTSHGLMTYQQEGLRRTRIQALKLEEGLLRRWSGLATIRVDSAGDHTEVDEKKKRDMLVPVLRREDADDVARQVLPNLNQLMPTWTRVSRLAIGRGTRKGWLLVATAIAFVFTAAEWYCLFLLPAFPLVYFLNERWYHHTGYWFDEQYLLFRNGWFHRSTICVPTKNVQSVALRQNFFDRRLNLATLHVDIAGQSNTGGGPKIKNLPIEIAKQMQLRFADQAATTEFNW